MTTTTESKKMLVAALRDAITDDDNVYLKPQAYWDDVALKKKRFTEVESALLTLSPMNRVRFDMAVERTQQLFMKTAANNNRPVALAAASSGTREPIRFEDQRLENFLIYIRPSGATDWHVTLMLTSGTPALGTRVELKDDDGNVWAEGTFDDTDEITYLLDALPSDQPASSLTFTLFVNGQPLDGGGT